VSKLTLIKKSHYFFASGSIMFYAPMIFWWCSKKMAPY